jgi:hypothetical protein
MTAKSTMKTEQAYSEMGAEKVKTKSLDELLKECQDDFRNTLLDELDRLWLDGQATLTVPQLNAINAATCELTVQWGLKGWNRATHIHRASPKQHHQEGL